MHYYEQLIIEATGCSEDEAEELEEIMRDHIFNGILGESTRAKLMSGAKKAVEIKAQLDAELEAYH